MRSTVSTLASSRPSPTPAGRCSWWAGRDRQDAHAGERFAWLVDRGRARRTRSSSLTYSPAAAADLRERLESRVERPTRSCGSRPSAAFCARLLRDEALEAGLDPFFAPVTPRRPARAPARADRRPDAAPPRDPRQPRAAARELRRADRPAEGRDDRAAASTAPRGAAAGRRRRRRRARACRAASSSSRACTPTTTRCWPSAARSTSATSCCTRFRLLHEHPHVRERVARALPPRAGRRLQDATFSRGHAAAAARRGARERHGRRRRRPGDPPLRGAVAQEPARLPARVPRRALVRLERSHRSGRADPATPPRAVVGAGRARAPKTLRARGSGRVRFWRCSSERAQAQAGGRRGRAADRRRASPPEEVCVLVRSVQRRGRRRRRRRSRSARSRSAPAAPPRTSSAPRCATCSPGCGCSPTPATPAPSCARCRARRSSCARSTSRG